MAIRKGLRLTALVSSISLVSLALFAGIASAKTKPADLRVVTSDGTTLADYTQYTGGGIKAKADERATCFGEDNPSSNKSYTLTQASPLSALIDAKSHDDELSPLRLTDAFVDDGFGFGVCRIGQFSFSPVNFTYWYSSADYAAGSTGPDLIKLHDGDHVLWYLTNGSESGFPSELELKAPVRVKGGDDYTVKVVRHLSDGSTEPAAGVTVNGGASWNAMTDGEGELVLNSGTTGSTTMQAIGGVDDVPSNVEKVCAAAKLSDCPAYRPETIYGSSRADQIKGGKGDDKIRGDSGYDMIDVHSGGADKVNCGPGKDTVIRAKHQRGLELTSCEKVKRRSS